MQILGASAPQNQLGCSRSELSIKRGGLMGEGQTGAGQRWSFLRLRVGVCRSTRRLRRLVPMSFPTSSSLLNNMNEIPVKDRIILHLCASEYGSDTRDYKEAGYDVRYITKDIGVENYHPPKNVYGIIANPPCTMFSKARTNAKLPRDLQEGMRLVKECLRIIWECQTQIARDVNPEMPLKFWVLENPYGYLKWFLGKPAFLYRHREYGGTLAKTTALWGVFNEPQKPFWSNQEKEKWEAGWGKSDIRSVAPPLFTKAFYLANP